LPKTEPFKTNKRRGYLERKKVFFTDLGIRNSLIEDFRPMHLRQDIGAVFENLIVMGAFRQTFYQRNNNKLFYFRDISGKQREIDLIIESPDSAKIAYEIKLKSGKSNQFPELDIGTYEILSKENAPNLLV
jgi:predicted AAA+ superfamily ATPase